MCGCCLLFLIEVTAGVLSLLLFFLLLLLLLLPLLLLLLFALEALVTSKAGVWDPTEEEIEVLALGLLFESTFERMGRTVDDFLARGEVRFLRKRELLAVLGRPVLIVRAVGCVVVTEAGVGDGFGICLDAELGTVFERMGDSCVRKGCVRIGEAEAGTTYFDFVVEAGGAGLLAGVTVTFAGVTEELLLCERGAPAAALEAEKGTETGTFEPKARALGADLALATLMTLALELLCRLCRLIRFFVLEDWGGETPGVETHGDVRTEGGTEKLSLLTLLLLFLVVWVPSVIVVLLSLMGVLAVSGLMPPLHCKNFASVLSTCSREASSRCLLLALLPNFDSERAPVPSLVTAWLLLVLLYLSGEETRGSKSSREREQEEQEVRPLVTQSKEPSFCRSVDVALEIEFLGV